MGFKGKHPVFVGWALAHHIFTIQIDGINADLQFKKADSNMV